MKNISKYLSVVLLLLGAACSKTQEGPQYNPNKDDAKEIHFIQSSIEKEFAQDAEQGVIDVQVARTGNKGSYTVYLSQKGNDAALFTIQPEVTFPDGAFSVTVPVTVNLTDFKMGSNYKTTLVISEREEGTGENGAQISQYSDKVTLSASYELTWEPYMRTNSKDEKIQQLATYYYSQYYTGRDSGLEVEKAVGANIFRLKDWASGVTFRFVLHDDNTVTVPAQSIGYFNSNYNEYVYVADMAVYTGNDAAYGSYPCTFDGTSEFSFYLIYYVSAGYFGQGRERLVFDIDPDTTPIVDIEFRGIETSATGIRAPKLFFSPNSYARSYKATVVAGDITSNVQRQEEVRQQLIDDQLESVTPVVTLFAEDESTWNVPKGNYTAVALAYDSIDNPCNLYTRRFTCDPEEEFAITAPIFEWYASDKFAGYSPYTTLFWDMKVTNVASMKYLCVTTTAAEYLTELYNMTPEELTAVNGREMPEDAIAQMLSDDGRQGLFQNLDEGTSYTIMLLMANQFGDTYFVSKTASTWGHDAKDFDQTKTLDDFLGAFNVTATVSVGSNTSQARYRLDIARVSDNEVEITGASDMRDFSPVLRGFYDEDKHMLLVEPQSAGMYGQNYAVLGLYDGLSLYWGDGSLAIGYIGDTLYWSPSPYTENNLYGYMFLLFSSPQANSSTYLREYVGSKIYTFVRMTPLKMAPPQPAAISASSRDAVTIATDTDRPVRVQLMSDKVLSSGPRSAAKAAPQTGAPAASQPEGKTLRTDLVLRTR